MCVEQQRQELRFLVTQRCNYDCTFCHREGLQTRKDDLLKAEDFRFIFAVAKKHFNFETVTLTGGEPLIRRDIIEIASGLSKESAEITLVTNGFLLEDRIYIGNYVKRINVSLHSLKKGLYEAIVRRRNVFDKVVYGLQKFRYKYPEAEIRINSTLVDGANATEEDILDLVKFADGLDASIKYVELFPPGDEGFVPIVRAQEVLLKNGFSYVPSQARKISLSNASTEVILTKIFCAVAKDHPSPSGFCRGNNDLFVSPDGKIKPCRHNLDEVDIIKETTARDESALSDKIGEALKSLGRNCIIDNEGKNPQEENHGKTL